VVGQGAQQPLDAAERRDLELDLLVPGQVRQRRGRLVLHVRRGRVVVHRREDAVDAARGPNVRRVRSRPRVVRPRGEAPQRPASARLHAVVALRRARRRRD